MPMYQACTVHPETTNGRTEQIGHQLGLFLQKELILQQLWRSRSKFHFVLLSLQEFSAGDTWLKWMTVTALKGEQQGEGYN